MSNNGLDRTRLPLDVLRELAMRGALSIPGLQLAYAEADRAADDEQLEPDDRAAAAWLREQAGAELFMAELDYGVPS